MLTQFEAEGLMALAKRFIAAPPAISVPPGADDSYELTALTGRERFALDVQRGTFRMSRPTLNERVRTCVVLVRLDIDGRPHTNPDGTAVGRSHLHVYREGFEDKWAIPLAEAKAPGGALAFPGTGERAQLFKAFCAYCHIQDAPAYQEWIQ